MTETATENRLPRIAAVDALRGVALAAMIVYHFAWNLSDLGIVSVDVRYDPGWTAFARTIAGTFIGLAGVSLVLATRRGLRLRPYLIRLAKIVGAAILISAGTFWFVPHAYVFFGILHLIAFASVAALPFIRLPAAIVLLAGIAILALPFFFRSEVFSVPLLWWVGLTPRPPASIDYVPVFPWFALALFGVIIGRVLVDSGTESAFARWMPSNFFARLPVAAGRWSLLIYLVHIPVIVAVLTLFAAPDARTQAVTFTRECVTSCRATGREPPVCEIYCGCVLAGIEEAGFLPKALAGRMTAEENNRWLVIVNQCRPTDRLP